MSVSFHCVIKDSMKAPRNIAKLWNTKPSFVPLDESTVRSYLHCNRAQFRGQRRFLAECRLYVIHPDISNTPRDKSVQCCVNVGVKLNRAIPIYIKYSLYVVSPCLLTCIVTHVFADVAANGSVSIP